MVLTTERKQGLVGEVLARLKGLTMTDARCILSIASSMLGSEFAKTEEEIKRIQIERAMEEGRKYPLGKGVPPDLNQEKEEESNVK